MLKCKKEKREQEENGSTDTKHSTEWKKYPLLLTWAYDAYKY